MAFGTLKADTLTHSTAGSLATNYVVNGSSKVWAATEYSSGTPVISDSLNVSSVSDDDTGEMTFSISSALSSANFSITTGPFGGTGAGNMTNITWFDRTTSAYSILTVDNGTREDRETGTTVMGDLA